jgi:3-oxoacyl-[acyl-carrier protein] reductase
LGSPHIIVSGGSRGLGQTLVRGLLDANYRVSTFSRRPTEFTERLAGEGNFFFATADASDSPSLSAFVKSAGAKFGCPYGLINCAGVAIDGVLATMAEQSIDKLLSTNLRGMILLTKLVVRRMLVGTSRGVILNISSIIGVRGYSGLSVYASTKAGMDGMTRALARELGPRRIRVNSIAPGYLETEMTRGLDQRQREQIVRRTPLGRLGVPDDIVGPVLFLFSDAASFITGQIIVVDGGITT